MTILILVCFAVGKPKFCYFIFLQSAWSFCLLFSNLNIIIKYLYFVKVRSLATVSATITLVGI